MKPWFRVTLPGDGAAVGFVCLYAACYLPDVIFYLYGGEGEFLCGAAGAPVQSLHSVVLLLVAVVYAGLRVYAFHPVFSKEYRDWLKQTPWRYGLPLPLGPVHLVPQDVVILGILSGLGWRHLGEFWWLVPCAFLASHAFFMMTTFVRAGLNRHAYLVAFGLGGVVWLYEDPLRLKLLLLGLYGVSFHGLRQCLKQFEDWDWAKFNERLGADSEGQRKRRLGWPFDFLGPHRHPFPMSYAWAAALAVLAGWWVFGLTNVLAYPQNLSRETQVSPNQGVLAFSVFLVGLALAIGRLGKYAWGYAPPISFRGRIAIRQWIIPGYDVIFAAPLTILAIVASLKWLLVDFRVPTENALALVSAAYVFVAFGCPPSLDEWRLTGNHRIVPAVPKQEMQQLP